MATQTQPTSSGAAIPVTADNFIRAETDRTFASHEKKGAFGKFVHFRALAPVEDQHVQRTNRDTLYRSVCTISMPGR